MRKCLWIVLAVLAVLATAGAAPNARADSFNAIFTCTTPCGSLPTSPPVAFPSATTDVSYYGYSFWLPLFSSASSTDKYVWYGIDTTTLDPPFRTLSFDISDLNTGVDSYLITTVPSSFSVMNHRESGSLVFNVVATPEPASLLLLLAGMGVALVFWKRVG